MLSKHSSRSSLRASLNSLRLLFESPLEKSVQSVAGGDETERRRADTVSTDGRTDATETREDISALESEDSVSVSETRDAVSKCSSLPDIGTPNPARDLESEADLESESDRTESRNQDLILTPPTKERCACECSGPLGMEGGIISNQQITASSTLHALFGLQKWHAHLARLNRRGLINAWSPAESDRAPWLQVNLERRLRVTGLITQGAKRIGSPEFVKSYKVAYSDDGKTWSTVKLKNTEEDMIFTGNTDNNSPAESHFSPPIEAQYIRIYPQSCRKHCTLRAELLGCELTGCSEPMGMKTGHIQDDQISSSSVHQTLNINMFSWQPSKARLDKQGKVNAWTPAQNDQSQWLQVDLLLPTKVTGIITQGAKDFGHVQFVGSFKLGFSNDGEKWSIYQDESQHRDKIFQGNSDNETHRKNVIDPPIYARFLRIIPWSWYGRITMRAELLGCSEE
ncbi:EGF-like repeat and discoidin I-like domain-containing protein 3 isoform X1 [Astyanax mexicanus]|uniref:EGF-like repeats and discoidin I-like domains 3b n=1 Tax=Astyanax mexicanus TaxID=7994 RepID=A0A3B1KBJ1_ASTMX|nr:EGF-like repeat and discoidin I-like domain-containing protein 3 isoform X1 [Astyanax mexicanus]